VPAVTITSFDGTKLAANLFLPRRTSSTQTFPTIVMIASWAAPGRIEYIGQQQRLAKDGYVVASYSARGFWLSEGLIGAAAPEDVRDVSSVIDWLQANAPVDAGNIAASGISYGAGLSLMALAKDTRIKTAVALSGWATMADELYPRSTGNLTWGNLPQPRHDHGPARARGEPVHAGADGPRHPTHEDRRDHGLVEGALAIDLRGRDQCAQCAGIHQQELPGRPVHAQLVAGDVRGAHGSQEDAAQPRASMRRPKRRAPCWASTTTRTTRRIAGSIAG
jgi:predicted acyl esterase